MRPHGRAQIDPRAPRALALCDRCQFLVNHDTLRWQMRWRGPRMQNIRMLVCEGCYDVPNEQERTFVLPVDPVPIANPRPENYVIADNPMSPIGFNPINNFLPGSSLGQNIGTLTQNAGLDAAFTQAPPRPYEMCAALSVSDSSFGNWVGKAWNGDPTGISLTMPSSAPIVQNAVANFTAYAPTDQPFLRAGATSWMFQGSSDGVSWTTVSSGTTAGLPGESVTSFAAGGSYAFHRFALQGDGFSAVGVAGLVLNVSNAAPNEI